MIQTVDRLNQFLEEYSRKWPLSGAVLVARKGEILLNKACGFANIEHGVPNRAGTKFGIWSITKSFTAMAIMMLAAQRKLQLDDAVGRFFPGFGDRQDATIEHLLNHASGFVNFTNRPEYNARLNKWPLNKEQMLQIAFNEPLEFPPGSSFSYNNTGYFMLGMIIESVSGMTYKQFIEERILKPLGMDNTGTITGRQLIPGLASSYHSSGYEVVPSEYIDMSTVVAAGSMYSTVDDLYKWDQALYGDQLLPQNTIRRIFHADGAAYGLGWFLGKRHNRRTVYHGGAYRGFRSELHRYPDDDTTVILLSNYNFTPVTKVAEYLSGELFGEAPEVPSLPSVYPIDSAQFERYRGVYEGYGCKAVVDCDEDGMYFLWNDCERNPIYPISESRFHHAWLQWEYSFKQEEDGSIVFLGMTKLPRR